MRGLDYKLDKYIKELNEDAGEVEVNKQINNNIHVSSVMRDIAQDLKDMLEGRK